jgi:hypothetical protein
MARLTALLERGQARTNEFLRNGVDQWVDEGRIDEQRRDQLLCTLNAPEAEAAFLHAGAHFAISLPLRFPFGATARFLYTLGLRLKAEADGLLHRSPPVRARRCHTVLVMLFALLPGFGRLAYFFSPALAGDSLLLVIPLDQVSRKLPFQAYRRLHLDALFIYWAQEKPPRRGLRHFLRGGWHEDLKERAGDVARHGRLIAALLAFDITALLIGAYLYVDSDRTSVWWFDERNVMATIDVVQLFVAGICGIAAYRLFWQLRQGSDSEEAAGIFLWAIGGIGLLVFAIDDYLTIHESMGRQLERGLTVLPFAVNMPDDLLVLGYAVVGVAVLYVFRMEVFADRPSATLLQFAAAAAIVMVLADIFAHATVLRALEYPSQTLANGLLALAFIVRYREVAEPATAVARDPASVCTA